MIKHIVFFKLIDPTRENLERCRDILLNMKGKVPMLLDLEVGVDVLRSKRSFDLVLIALFDSLKDLDDYQIDPIHVTAKNHLSPFLEMTHTVDYEVETAIRRS